MTEPTDIIISIEARRQATKQANETPGNQQREFLLARGWRESKLEPGNFWPPVMETETQAKLMVEQGAECPHLPSCEAYQVAAEREIAMGLARKEGIKAAYEGVMKEAKHYRDRSVVDAETPGCKEENLNGQWEAFNYIFCSMRVALGLPAKEPTDGN